MLRGASEEWGGVYLRARVKQVGLKASAQSQEGLSGSVHMTKSN